MYMATVKTTEENKTVLRVRIRMAAVLSQNGATGFYKAPVSKGIFGCMFLTSCALNVPLLTHLKQYIVCSIPSIFEKLEVWRLITSKITFLDTKDVVCGSLLIYYFRIFERRYGSHKFASYLFAACTVATILELVTTLFLRSADMKFMYLPTGPYGLIFPLFVNYYMDIPRVAQTYIMGVPVTGKTLTYLLGLQMISTNRSTMISGICSLLAGIICKWNFFRVLDIIKIPKFVARFSNLCFGWLLHSSPPHDGTTPIGATVEIQRQMQFELMEQQVLVSRTREVQQRMGSQNRHQMAQGYSERLISPQQPNGDGGLFVNSSSSDVWSNAFRVGSHRNNVNSDTSDNGGANSVSLSNSRVSFQEDQVRTLVEMGFERQNVLRALQSSNNDIHLATSILLNEG